MATASSSEADSRQLLQLNATASNEYTRDLEHDTTALPLDPDYASAWDFSMLINPADSNSPRRGYVSMVNRPLPLPQLPVPPRLIIDTTLPLEDQM